MKTIGRFKFLGYPVDSLNLDDALDWMESAIQSHTTHQVTVTNANKLWQMSKDKRLERIIKNSDLVLPEWAVYWGATQLGLNIKDYVCGIVLLKASLPWAEERGMRLFFLGAKPEVVEALQNKLSEEYPNLEIAGMYHGYFDPSEENEAVCLMIRDSRPDILYVALGSPKQEYWIEENLKKVNVPIAMGVGGSFDVIAGLKKDTPNWARGHGIEWLYRLLQDPKVYWKRYMITNPWFVWQVWKEKYPFLKGFNRASIHSSN